MKKQTSDQMAAAALAPLIRYCAATRGAVQDVARRAVRRSGQKMFRQEVERWLCQDPKRRVEPRFGIGLLLLAVWTDMGVAQRRASLVGELRRVRAVLKAEVLRREQLKTASK